MKRICIYSIIMFLTMFPYSGVCQDVITMAYRPTEKKPYINAAPSNYGLYQNIFMEAARRVGLGFKIERYPKKRAYRYLEKGIIDFYPGASFNLSREQIGYFIDNCMAIKGGMLLYRDDIEINSVTEVKGYTLLYNLGGTTSFFNFIGVDVKANRLRKVPNLSIDKAITILQSKQSDFYAYDLTAMEEYFKKKQVTGIKKITINFENQIDYLIFSKKSKYYQERSNPHYDPSKKKSIKNLPYTLDEQSIAYKFQETLKSMQKNGEIEREYLKVLDN